MAWPTKPKSGLPSLPGLKKLPKAYNDQNLNSAVPMPANPPAMSTDRLASPAALAAPKAPTSINETQLSPRAQKFRRLAGILGPKK
jgi:hypothetical protein